MAEKKTSGKKQAQPTPKPAAGKQPKKATKKG